MIRYASEWMRMSREGKEETKEKEGQAKEGEWRNSKGYKLLSSPLDF